MPRLIARVADEKTQRAFQRMAGEILRHFVLLQLVAREDDEPLRPRLFQDQPREGAAERAGAAGDQDLAASKPRRHARVQRRLAF
jgi:hypothetical protein